MMKNFLWILFLSLLVLNMVEAESLLPKCKGMDSSKWTNCQGTIRTADGKKYVGEFKDGQLIESKKKLKKIKRNLIMMESVTSGFDFICYNSCKERNDDAFCRKQCSLQ